MANIVLRKYKDQDFEAIVRIWEECGWLSEKMDSTMQEIIGAASHVLAEIDGSVEAVAMCTAGELRYLEENIKGNLIDALTVSLVARKTGLAKRSLVKLLAEEAEKGAALSILGMFEQGFYNKLGYGTGTYYRQIHFDPADLNISANFRIPQRLSGKDYLKVHESRLKRRRTHGGFNVLTPIMTKSEMDFMKKSFGLGYFDDQGNLTHHIWINPDDKEFGPFEIEWMSYQDHEQFMELMALIKSFDDQVRKVSITEPADIQIIDLLKKPIRKKNISKGGKYQSLINSYAFWQIRVLDLAACLKQTHLPCKPLEFNLRIDDPLSRIIDKGSNWRGCSGDYHVRLAEESQIADGLKPGLPLLEAGIGAFSRLWLGVKPASGLAVTDNLKADEGLLKKLDNAFRLPEPHPDWWF